MFDANRNRLGHNSTLSEVAARNQKIVALPDLIGVLNGTRKEKVRRTALTAIAMLPDPANRSIYTQYLGHKDEHLRAAAAEGFGRLRNPADITAIATAAGRYDRGGGWNGWSRLLAIAGVDGLSVNLHGYFLFQRMPSLVYSRTIP